jgi:hypothetical protein
MNAALDLAMRLSTRHGPTKLLALDSIGHSERLPVLEMTTRLAEDPLAWLIAGRRTCAETLDRPPSQT